MKSKRHLTLLTLSLITILSSCARQISSDVYSAQQVGEVSYTHPGVIRSFREVTVEHGEQLQDNTMGIAGGGIAGGVIGNAAGRGNFVPTALGAVAGAVAGSFVEKKLKEQSAIEYIVQLDNGSLMTLVQGKDQIFSVGQPVYVIVSAGGRSRITPQ